MKKFNFFALNEEMGLFIFIHRLVRKRFILRSNIVYLIQVYTLNTYFRLIREIYGLITVDKVCLLKILPKIK